MTAKDWIAWHAAYDDDTPLHHRSLADPAPLVTARRLFTFIGAVGS